VQLERLETPERRASLELLALPVKLDFWEWLAQQDLWVRLELLEEQDSLGLLEILVRKDLMVNKATLAHLDPMDNQVLFSQSVSREFV